MYLAPYLILLAVAAAIGSVFSGGVFTIILVPAAVIAAVAAVLTGGAARAGRLREAMVDNTPTPNPAPQNSEPEAAPGDQEQQVTPEQYLEARRRAQ